MYGGRETEPKQEVYRVGVRIPPFWAEDPLMWFSQIEYQFKLANISADETKFYYVSSNLEPQYAREVRDIISNPPATNKYDKFKAELIKRLSVSNEKKIKQLLMHEELGDRKPSQFLRHLMALAGPDVPSDFLITIWTSRLPLNVQTAIATQKGASTDKLTELADVVYEMAPPTPQVASSSSANSEMAQQISELTRQVALLTQHISRTGRARSQTRNRRNNNRSKSRSRPRQPPQDHPHCFYHYTYGAKANKCKQPCSFQSGNSQGGRK
ncbi:uncharacterized protein LOC126381363 [Pectinophora gossypiella]|uniref:uncharacterized protein LOC126381124 n=1 Tax=Pectinophora gossypiella TaxID=13191 RepID=UPI00214EFA71|nr:uncharacterized protein LOC126381124 [Pectinophora gossypiella]XP_049886816.1 uncharacterized protein LOC126381363 [Pectinophora gossypiella]